MSENNLCSGCGEEDISCRCTFMEEILPTLTRFFRKNCMCQEDYCWDVDEVEMAFREYIRTLEGAAHALRRLHQKCIHLSDMSSAFCDNDAAPGARNGGYCEMHADLFRCKTCRDAVCTDFYNQCNNCWRIEINAKNQESMQRQAKRKLHDECVATKKAMLGEVVTYVAAHPPNDIATCQSYVAMLSVVDDDGVGVTTPESASLQAWLQGVASVFETYPAYALCMVRERYPPPFNPYEFK